MRCNESCPIFNYKGEEHFCCKNTPYGNFFEERDYESALVELNFLRKVYLDFLENEIQEQYDELCMAKKAEAEEAKEEWVNITKELTAKVDMISKHQGYIKLYHNGYYVVYTQSNCRAEGLELVSSHCDYKVETKGGDFNVFKRIEK